MEKEFLTYNQALKLKELGFDEECIKYQYKSENPSKESILKNLTDEDYIGIPLKSQAFRWFREKHNYNHSIVFTKHPFGTDEYQYMILLEDNEYVEINFKTYEEAESACLDKLIEIVESKEK